MPQGEKLTAKQQRFVDAYDGNATEAARIAGYKGNAVTLQAVGKENLRKPLVAAAIREREAKRTKPHIMNREERQAMWTEMAKNPNSDPNVRLRASELLAKSEGDFLQRVNVEGNIGLYRAVPDDQLVALAERIARGGK